jgi:hypothetical protein
MSARAPIFDAIRKARGTGFTTDEVQSVDSLLDTLGIPRDAAIAVQPVAPAAPAAGHRPIAWGARVSQTFRDRVWWIADTLRNDPDDIMSCIAFESGQTFSASVRNMAGSGAVGLIQFMPSTAQRLGTSSAALAAMTAENQLRVVYQYFRPWAGKLRNLADLYMAILWPAAVGKPDDYVLFSGGVAYRQNAGLDTNRDSRVTKAEAAAKLYAMRAEGLRKDNVG